MNTPAGNSNEQVNSREPLFDILRGVAVLLMIAAHAIFFFHTDTSEVLRTVARLGNATVFTMLLLVSGVVSYHAYFSGNGKHIGFQHIGKRMAVIYVGYCFVSLVAIFTDPKVLSWADVLTRLLASLTFFEVPGFSEFLIPFLIYPLTLVLFPRMYQWIYLRARVWLLFALLSYATGMWLFLVPVPWELAPYKAILVGEEGFLRFPIVQYFPVFSLGLLWGYHLRNTHANDFIVPLYKKVFASGGLVVLCGLIGLGLSIPLLDPTTRWPPSIGFLTLGVFATSVTALVVLLVPKTRTTEGLWRTIAYIGADSFDLYITHIILLHAYRRFIGEKFDSELTVGLLTFALLILSILLSSVNWKTSPSLFTVGPITLTNARRYRIKKRYIIGIALFSLIIYVHFTTPATSTIGEFLTKEDLVPKPDDVSVKVSRQWLLKRPGESLGSVTVTLTEKEPSEGMVYTYEIPKLSLFGKLPATPSGGYVYTIPFDGAAVGEYQLVINSHDAVPGFPLYETKIYVSHPLYVSWTLDWEGWNVADKALREIERISTHFDLPITHFFNPRIYMPHVASSDRSSYLTGWLKSRAETNNDEIALHLHMHYDIASASGVVARNEPRWKYRSAEGYDVYTTAYTKDEMHTLIGWAIGEFEKNGLPRPLGYRAGGWYANLDLLQTLSEYGFLYDASGRERPVDGPFRNIIWNLHATSLPYYPSVIDLNAQGDDHLSVLEIPNNGLDTFTFQPYVLLQKYYANYSGGFLTEPRVVSYVSHPQWYQAEFPKIEQVLTTISEQSAQSDMGPVIFVTQQEIYNVWKR